MYNLALHIIKPNWLPFPQGQDQSNLIKAEEFVFNDQQVDYAIVGTSLIGRFVTDSLYNLAFGGGSAMTGLKIIKHSNKVPKIIFVETNRLYMEANAEVLDKISTPINRMTKSWMPCFQTKNNPISFFIAAVRYIITGKKQNTSIYSDTYSKELKEISLNNIRKAYKNDFETSEFDNITSELNALINEFRKKGAKVVFFELPIEKEIEGIQYFRTRRAFVKKLFPKSANSWIDDQDASQFETTDGFHLIPKSCRKYNLILNQSIPRILEMD